MRRLARLVLIAVLAMLVPLKGMAAVGYMPCGPAGEPATAAVRDPAGGHAHTPMPGSGTDVGHADPTAAAHPDAPSTHGSVDGSHATTGDGSHGPAKCTHGMPCASAVAPPVAVPTLAWADLSSLLPVAADVAWTVVTMPLPERPPRPHLA